MTSRVRVSARSRPSPPLYPHFNQPSGFWPCVKSCLVGGSDKYYYSVFQRKKINKIFIPQDLKYSHTIISAPGMQLTLPPDLSLFWLAVFHDTFSLIKIDILAFSLSFLFLLVKKKQLHIFLFSAQPKIKRYFRLFHFNNILYYSSKINVLILF